MVSYRHLTKEEELAQGALVQKMMGAKDELLLIEKLKAGENSYKDIELIDAIKDSQFINYEMNHASETFARVEIIKKPGVKTSHKDVKVTGGLTGSTKKRLYIDTSQKRIAFLARCIRTGNKSVDVLAKANLGLVYNQARKFKLSYPSSPEIEDLAQEGMSGLVTAILKYDPSRGNKLSTVATSWIYQAISRGTNKTGRIIKLPENRINEYIEITKIIKRYEEENLTSSEIEELVLDELDLTKEEYFSIINAASTPLSLNYRVNDDSENDSTELIDIIDPLHTSESSEETLVNYEISNSLSVSIDKLNDIEKDVVSSTFRLNTDENGKRITAKEIREKHNLSLQKFKKILDESLVKMKSDLSNDGISYSDFNNQFD